MKVKYICWPIKVVRNAELKVITILKEARKQQKKMIRILALVKARTGHPKSNKSQKTALSSKSALKKLTQPCRRKSAKNGRIG